MRYDKDKDYQGMMNDAVKNNDLYSAALYEAQRNAKIKGEGLNYATTNNYGNYLYNPNTDYAKGIADAEKRGDFSTAAQNEAYRNAKVRGEGIGTQTNRYSAYTQAVANRQSAQNALNNRQPFSYSAEDDPLYQMYKEQYMSGGKMAMEDTVGKSAAMTGGYGNSYAQTAGQQVYNQYMDQLAGKIPELYQAAYNRYADDESRALAAYDRANAAEQAEYNRLVDSRNYDYQREMDERNFAYQQQSDARSMAMTMLSSGVMPSAELLASAGISSSDASAILKQIAAETASASSGSGGGGGGYYRSSGSDEYDEPSVNENVYTPSDPNKALREAAQGSPLSSNVQSIVNRYKQQLDGIKQTARYGGDMANAEKVRSTIASEIETMMNKGTISPHEAAYILNYLDLAD